MPIDIVKNMAEKCVTPSFSFPFQPYTIQEKFMRELYFTIECNKSGIFESPTGTGKSLSICCSALQWLTDYNKKEIDDIQRVISEMKLEVSKSNANIDWLQEEYNKVQKNQALCKLQLKLEKIQKKKDQILEMKKRVEFLKLKVNLKSQECLHYFQMQKSKDILVSKSIQEVDTDEVIEDTDLIIEECKEIDNNYESETEENENEEDFSIKKIYISSRTHSQLSQFVGEIQRTVFNKDTRVVTVASRQHYCINSEVLKLKNVNLINERCLDLQKSKAKPSSKGDDGKVLKKTKTRSCSSCPYFNQSNINHLKERILTEIMDMEDLVKCGKELKACPYYASRAALDDAEVVLVSHAGIVSSGARSGMSLKLKDNILIMDEAHGLTAALENAHSAPVSAKHLSSVKTFLQLYLNKYQSKLSSKNMLSLNQIQYIVGRLAGMIMKSNVDKNEIPTILTLEEFVIKADIDHLNLKPLIDFCRQTKLAPKLHGFSMRYSQQMIQEELKKSELQAKKNSLKDFLNSISKKKEDNGESVDEKINQPAQNNQQAPIGTSPGTGLYALLDFLQMLCDRSENGRVLLSTGDENNGHIKYLLLNPTEHFVEVVKQCRSVIVAGGTMEPISEFVSLLTGGCDIEQVRVVKCDHVVSPENVLAVCMSKGPTNVALNFSYERRGTGELLSEIGRILRNVCYIVPGGVVCFLPSYSYEQLVFDHLSKTAVIEAISKKKNVFREPKSAVDVEQVLEKYAAAIKNKSGDRNGALLLSVVGGKLSEGLNFSDDLGRCVIVVGMPYPNKNSPELKEKMNYLNRTSGSGSGSLYYESLCMKAVNQCIGRAVRHANDYACVLLLDERYSRPNIINALPSFVRTSLLDNCVFGKAFGSIGKFFTKHKQK